MQTLILKILEMILFFKHHLNCQIPLVINQDLLVVSNHLLFHLLVFYKKTIKFSLKSIIDDTNTYKIIDHLNDMDSSDSFHVGDKASLTGRSQRKCKQSSRLGQSIDVTERLTAKNDEVVITGKLIILLFLFNCL